MRKNSTAYVITLCISVVYDILFTFAIIFMAYQPQITYDIEMFHVVCCFGTLIISLILKCIAVEGLRNA